MNAIIKLIAIIIAIGLPVYAVISWWVFSDPTPGYILEFLSKGPLHWIAEGIKVLLG